MYGQAETSVKVQNLDAKTDREDSANGEISGMVATPGRRLNSIEYLE